MFKKFVSLAFVLLFLLSIMVAGGVGSPETTVYVDPEEITVKVGETFTVDVNILDVSGLQGFDFMMAYDTTILDCLKVEEGPFIASYGPTFVAKLEVEDEYTAKRGRVWVAAVILGDKWADGSGTLATVTFKATSPGETVLNLYSEYPYQADHIKICTCSSELISHTAVDGYVVVSADPADPPDPPNPHDSDVNGDRTVDIYDVVIVALAFGSYSGNPNWNPVADLNEDEIVDIYDVVAVAQACIHT